MRRWVPIFVVLAACAPAERDGASAESGACSPGETRACYDGAPGTEGVGPCQAGVQTCAPDGTWSVCQEETVPRAELCGNGIDDNCNGQIDEDVDLDGDGYTTCGGDCCDSNTVCSHPGSVNPAAFDVPGDGIDNDCNGAIDDSQAACDVGLVSNSGEAQDYARALDVCRNVIDASLTLPDGTGTPDPNAYSIRKHFGSHVMPRGGTSMVLLSTGAAAGKGDFLPAYHDFTSYTGTKSSGFPADFYAANGHALPNAPGCPAPIDSAANDPVMLTLHLKVPSNAHSFALDVNFFSSEFPEWTCSRFNDFFVVLLDSKYTGNPANPADKNLAVYRRPDDGATIPIGTNLAHGETGLFTQCVNGKTGCASGTEDGIFSCTGTDQLAGTGFDDPSPNECDTGSLKGGATGWLVTTGNVVPGEVITLRIAIWDTSDHAFDSLAVVDGFRWSEDTTTPGTMIY